MPSCIILQGSNGIPGAPGTPGDSVKGQKGDTGRCDCSAAGSEGELLLHCSCTDSVFSHYTQ